MHVYCLIMSGELDYKSIKVDFKVEKYSRHIFFKHSNICKISTSSKICACMYLFIAL